MPLRFRMQQSRSDVGVATHGNDFNGAQGRNEKAPTKVSAFLSETGAGAGLIEPAFMRVSSHRLKIYCDSYCIWGSVAAR